MAAKPAHTLLVLRHAKSDQSGEVRDAERPLADRGRREAPLVGDALVSRGPLPDLVLCSPAVRARQTWELAAERVAAAGAGVPQVRYDERIYAAGAQDLLDVVTETHEDVATLLLVGHNPGMEQLVARLATGDEPALAQVREKFPTSALAVLDVPGPWAHLRFGGARLVDLVVPRPA